MSDYSQEIRAANRAALDAARSALPDQPLPASENLQADLATTLVQFEVVLAFNLDPPYRWSQEIFWLEVLAQSAQTAVKTAAEWTARSPGGFEPTDLVRRSSPHERSLGVDAGGRPLSVNWNLPIEDGLPVNSMVRDPITGFRVGFLARPEAEQRWLPPEGRDRYRLVMRKPVIDTEPVCLAPVVENVGPNKTIVE